MNTRLPFIIVFILIALLLLGISLPVAAAPSAQGFMTNTPQPDGRILYIVLEGETCSDVAFKHGISVAQLRQFNTRLDTDCTLTIGQQLVVGLAVQAGPTPGPAPTLLPPTATTTPVSGTTEVCVLLFDDANGDALRQETEFGVEGGAVSLTNLNGSYSEQQNTTAALDPDGEPIRACFGDVPGGEYNISVAPPDNFNPTMLMSYNLTVKAGDRASIDFGAQTKTITANQTAEEQGGGGRSSILGIFGLLLLLGGAGLGYYAYRSGQPRSKLKNSPLSKRE